MFTSKLSRILDVRLLPLIAALLLSACALHRPDAPPDAAPTPSTNAPVLPHVDLPEFDISVPDVTVPDLAVAEPKTPEITRWVTHAPSFVLVGTSEAASDLATSALQPTSAAFGRLFGERPPLIAVAVVDTSNGRPFVEVPEPPKGMTSIVMVGSGLTGPDSAITAEVLTSELRFEAATAWLFDYTADWRESLGLAGVRPLPDWMQLALLRMLTDPSVFVDAHPLRGQTTMSLAKLFTHHVTGREADAALSLVRASSHVVDDGTMEWQRGLAFTKESTNLLVFLRHTLGDGVFVKIVGAAAAGLPMPEILRRLPEPMTIAELNVAFRNCAKGLTKFQALPKLQMKHVPIRSNSMTLRLPVTFAATDRTDPRPSAMVAVVGDTYVRAGIEPM